MAISVSFLVFVTSLHLHAIGAESRRSRAKVVADEYDEETYCLYTTDASTVYGLSAFCLPILSHAVVLAVTRCLCFGKGLIPVA